MDINLHLIANAEQLKHRNKVLKEGMQSASMLIGKLSNDIKRLDSLLLPSSKTGHKKLLQKLRNDMQFDLDVKKNEYHSFEDEVKVNKVLIKALTQYIKQN